MSKTVMDGTGPARALRRLVVDQAARERFERFRVVRANGCIEWTGSLNRGYGLFSIWPGMTILAHRAAYQLRHGELADGMQLDHLCRNPCCSNPDHLDVVTSAENTRRGNAPGTALKRAGTCKRGHPLVGRTAPNKSHPNGFQFCGQCPSGRRPLPAVLK